MNPRLNRQIGYQKPEKSEKKENPAPKKADAPKSDLKPQDSALPTSEGIWSWFEENDNFLKIKGFCIEIGYDEGNFSRLRKKKAALPTDIIEKLHPLMKKYGY